MAQHVLTREQKLRQKEQPQLSPLVGTAAGKGENRRLVLPLDAEARAVFGATEPLAAEEPPMSETCEAATPCLAYGIKCLKNALQLCEAQLRTVATADYSALQVSASQGTLSPSEEVEVQLHLVQRLSQLQLAWCALLQDDYVQALDYSNPLLKDDCPPNLKLYAHLYTADALCHLNRSAEALEHLAAAMQLGEILSVATCSGEAAPADGELESIRNPYSAVWSAPAPGSQQQPATKPPGAVASRAILYANLATVHLLRQDTQQAMQYVQQALAIQPDSRQALLCLVYLELAAGNTDRAVDVLKKQRVPNPK